MKEKIIRGYYRSSKAWYHRPENGIEITFGLYSTEGGSIGEMTMSWHELSRGILSPKLSIWCDAWKVFASFTDLHSKLSEVDNVDISESDFAKILDTCGFKDLTAYERI